MTDPNRAAFEAWWKSCHQCRCEDKYGAVRDGWDAWQASRKAALEAALVITRQYSDLPAGYSVTRIKELLK